MHHVKNRFKLVTKNYKNFRDITAWGTIGNIFIGGDPTIKHTEKSERLGAQYSVLGSVYLPWY